MDVIDEINQFYKTEDFLEKYKIAPLPSEDELEKIQLTEEQSNALMDRLKTWKNLIK